MNGMSSSLIRRGRPPAHRGSSAASPRSLKAWITSRTVSSSGATSRAIAETGVPDADAMMIVAPSDPDRVPASAAHDLGQPLAFVIGQSSCSNRLRHQHHPLDLDQCRDQEWDQQPATERTPRGVSPTR